MELPYGMVDANPYAAAVRDCRPRRGVLAKFSASFDGYFWFTIV